MSVKTLKYNHNNKASGARITGEMPYNSLHVEPWGSHLTFLCLSFLFYKMVSNRNTHLVGLWLELR